MFFYTAFGLNIQSNVKLSFFKQIPNKTFNFQIKRDCLMSHFTPVELENSTKSTNEDVCKIHLKNRVLLEIHKDGKIIFEPLANLSNIELCKTLANMAFPMFFVMHDQIVLHASAFTISNKTFLFSGHSGSGKSTALIHGLQRSAKMITEDVAVLSIRENFVEITPSYPVVNINKSQISEDALFKGYKKLSGNENLKKDALHIVDFADNKERIDGCFFLNWSSENNVSEISDTKSFLNVIKNSWHSYPFYNLKKRTENQLNNISKFCSFVPCYELHRRKDANISVIEIIKENTIF